MHNIRSAVLPLCVAHKTVMIEDPGLPNGPITYSCLLLSRIRLRPQLGTQARIFQSNNRNSDFSIWNRGETLPRTRRFLHVSCKLASGAEKTPLGMLHR